MSKTKTILLLANYSLDQQYSMLQFADLLTEGLDAAGFRYILLRPKAYFGKLSRARPLLQKYFAYIDKYLIFPYLLRCFLRRWTKETLCIHILDHSNALYYPFCKGFSTFISCHDLIAIKAATRPSKAYSTGFLGRLLQRGILACLKRIPKVICLSRATQDAFIEIVGTTKQDLPIVYLSPHYNYRPIEALQATQLINSFLEPDLSEKQYYLHVGNDAWYKNREGLLYIHKALKESLGCKCPCLVLVGPKLNKKESALVANYGLAVIQLQGLSEELIHALYAKAQCLVLPSVQEGLGLPILEAMAVGCPVACTHMQPFTEIGGKAAVYLPLLEDVTGQGTAIWAKQCAASVEALFKETSLEKESRQQMGFQQARLFSKQNTLEGYFRIYATLGALPSTQNKP